MNKEAKVRIKINKLLEDSGWRLLDTPEGKANVLLENNVKITKEYIDTMGDNFEKSSNGFIDFLLVDDKGFPLVVLEAKLDNKHPLVGKDQARKYAKEINCRFIILSNGDLHYLWNTEHGNPEIVTSIPMPESFKQYNQFNEIRYFISNDKFNEMKRFELNEGDIIMSCSGAMDKIALVPKGIKAGIINQALLKLTPLATLNNKYLLYWMDSAKQLIEIFTKKITNRITQIWNK